MGNVVLLANIKNDEAGPVADKNLGGTKDI